MANSSHQRLSKCERRNRFGLLAIATVPLVLSALLPQGIMIPWLHCPLLRLTGIPCPAWGLTRSFVAIAHGNWQHSLAYHLLGPLLFLGFFLAASHLLFELVSNHKVQVFYSTWIQKPKVQLLSFCLLLGYHGSRLYSPLLSGELAIAFGRSWLGRLLSL